MLEMLRQRNEDERDFFEGHMKYICVEFIPDHCQDLRDIGNPVDLHR